MSEPLFTPLPAGPFATIYADPPWKYAFAKVKKWGVDAQYATLTAAQIGTLPVPGAAAEDSVLFLWTTSPKLPEGLAVLAAWGFTYKTSLIWDKGGLGMGYWVRVNHEILLIGTRGQPACPSPPGRPPSVFRSPRQRHSQKPAALYPLIEAMVPQGRRLELFARAPREGWESWGNELPG